MNEQKLKTVQQWRTALQEAARTAVEALAFETPINKAVPSLDERSEILGAAIHKIRELVRPEPKTVAFLEEEAWYRMKREAKPSGEYRTPMSAIDFLTANPPLNIPPAAEPIDPNAPKSSRGRPSNRTAAASSGTTASCGRGPFARMQVLRCSPSSTSWTESRLPAGRSPAPLTARRSSSAQSSVGGIKRIKSSGSSETGFWLRGFA